VFVDFVTISVENELKLKEVPFDMPYEAPPIPDIDQAMLETPEALAKAAEEEEQKKLAALEFA
jgi:hypothetical protein